ncbi:MAG: thiamine-phosphate kinase [Chlamydiales bacterium]|jgi:thiamine-monophosphate kinase|nr:thiamine-phosphate kinase [Chlamydiales bacterium]
MQFQKWGEDPFVEHLAQQFLFNDPVLGIGDDSAVIPMENGKAWLITTDALVEGVHFLKEQIAAKDLGYKAMAVNVSDIAAMGGEPKYAFLSVAFPKATDCSWIKLLIDGVKEACDKWDILLLGGDTVGSKRDIFLNVALIGSAFQDKIKYRCGAQPGDIICVSGCLGDSGGGLKALQEGTTKTREVQYLIRSHFHPEPSSQQGIWLACHHEVHAMMDLSDGLDCDLKRLMKKSKKGAEVEMDRIPISHFLSSVCLKERWDALQLALTGGEDYCLLLTVASEAFDNLQQVFQQTFHRSLFSIGRITNCVDELVYYKNGKKTRVNYTNYNHFQ